jgi:hypothetical protein
MNRFEAEIEVEKRIDPKPYMVYVCPAPKAFNRPRQFTISNGKRGKQMFHAVGGSWQLALADLDAKLAAGRVF